jgi:beta-N-acetylhexosaminidase
VFARPITHLGPLFVDLAGVELDAEDRELLASPMVGGVVLFARNYVGPEPMIRLCDELHALRTPPLLIAVDHEGGRIQRFREGLTALPSAQFLGRVWAQDREAACRLCRAAGFVAGAELNRLGIDLCFAPVVDLAHRDSTVIGDRAFGSDPAQVAELALHWIRGLESGGVHATIKHFPGHGGVAGDTHHEAAIDPRKAATLERRDLVPFRTLISRLPEISVMTAHVRFPALDPEPASLSAFWIGEVLRRRLGAEGAVVSDDLTMHALDPVGGLEDRTLRALEAGSDVVLICNDRRGAARLVGNLRHPQSPPSRLRLLRLHGTPRRPPGTLSDWPAWQASVRLLAAVQEGGELFTGLGEPR